MDFHSLARKELQALCKLNKIPANMTNVAMADALKVLPTVTGLDDIHDNPQFLSPLKAEKEFPDLPRTCRRTTARKKSIRDDSKEDVSATPMPRTCRRTKGEASGKGKDQEAPEVPHTPANGSKASASQPLTRRATAKRAGNKEKEEALPPAAEIPATTPANGLRASSVAVRRRAGTRSVIALRKEEEGGPVEEVQETPAGVGGRMTRLSTRKRMEEAMAVGTTRGGKVGVAKMAALVQEQEQKEQDEPEIKRAEETTEEERAGDKEAPPVSTRSIKPDVVLEPEGSSDQLAVEIKETDGGDCISGEEEQRSVEFTLEQSCDLVLDEGRGSHEETPIEWLVSLETPDSPIKGVISLDQTAEDEIYDQDVRGDAGLDLDFHQQQKHFSEIEESNEATREPPTPFDPSSKEDQTVVGEGFDSGRDEEVEGNREPEEPVKELTPPTPFDPCSKEDQTVGDEGFDSDRDEEGGGDREPEEPIREKDRRVEDDVPKFNQDDDQDDLNDGSGESLGETAGEVNQTVEGEELSKPAGSGESLGETAGEVNQTVEGEELSKPAGFTTEAVDDPDLELQDLSTGDVTDGNDDDLSTDGLPQNENLEVGSETSECLDPDGGDLIKNSQDSDKNLEVATETVIALPAICNQISPASEGLDFNGGNLIKNSLDSDVLVNVPVVEDEEANLDMLTDGYLIKSALDSDMLANVPVVEDEEANLDLLTGEAPVEIKEIGDFTLPEDNSSESDGDIIDESLDLNIAGSNVVFSSIIIPEPSPENVLASDAREINVSDRTSFLTESAVEILATGRVAGESNEPHLSIIPEPVPEESLVSELSQVIVGRSGGGGRGLPEEQGSKKKKKEGEVRKRIDSDKENAGIYSPPSIHRKGLTLLTSLEPIEVKSAKANKQQQPNTQQLQQDLQNLSMRKLKKLLSESNSNNKKDNITVTDGGSKFDGKKRSALSTLNENCLSSPGME